MISVTNQVTVTITGDDVHRLSLLCKLVGCSDARSRLTHDQEDTARGFAAELNSLPAVWDPGKLR